MNEETQFTIGRGEEQMGAFTQRELLLHYSPFAKEEGVWIEIDGERQSLIAIIKEWHGIQPASALKEVTVRWIPKAPFKANVNEKPRVQ